MSAEEEVDVERMRAAFFQRTRRFVGVFYVALAAAAVAVVAVGIALSLGRALVGLGVGFVATVLLFVVRPAIPTTARTARALIVAGPVVGVLVPIFFIDFDDLSTAWRRASTSGRRRTSSRESAR